MAARNGKISVKVNQEEEKIIQDKAEKVGLQKASFLRYLGLNANVSVTLENQ